MIVKKMPILQGFASFEDVRKLSVPFISVEDFRPIFYDIETTGLSQYHTFLYLIGAVVFENESWTLFQWFGESEEDEVLLLENFSAFVKNYTCSIQYNGNRFDRPYLKTRCEVHGLPFPLEEFPALDLYQYLKPCKDLLKLPGMKQPDLETFLHFAPRLFCNGKDGIRCYRRYLKSREEDLLMELLGHNQEDLMGLGAVLEMLAYRMLFDGNYEVESAGMEDDLLLVNLRLDTPVPALFSNGNTHFYISGEGTSVRLLIPVHQGRLRQYYSDYKKYDYLPSEDTAIPKTLSTYMDRSLRIPARPNTCYTWFSCDEAFLSDRDRQMTYLKHTLPCLLATLKK